MLKVLLEIRAWLLKIYQKTRFVVNPLAKFILSLLVFNMINTNMGYDARFSKAIISILLSALCAVAPTGVLVFFGMVLTVIHIFSVSMYLAIFVLLVYIIMYGFMMRFTPKQTVVVAIIPLLMGSNLHFAVPLILGCVANPLASMPTACGIFVYNLMKIIDLARNRQVGLDIDDVVQLYTDVIDAIVANKEMFVMMVIFALVIAVVWAIRRLPLDYAFEISLGAGVMVNILGFLIADLKFDATVSISTLIIMSVVCGIIAMLCDYMKRILDYTAIERVQFEDDDYYYYVKAVPKVKISLRKLDIKHFNRKVIDDEEYEYEEETEADDYENNDEIEKKAHRSVKDFFAGFGKKDKKKSANEPDEYETEYDEYELNDSNPDYDDDSDMKVVDRYSEESPEAAGFIPDNGENGNVSDDGDEGEAFENSLLDISDLLADEEDDER